MPDASRAVGVVTKLLSIDNAAGYKAGDRQRLCGCANNMPTKGVTLPGRWKPRAASALPGTAIRLTGRRHRRTRFCVLRNVDLSTLVDYARLEHRSSDLGSCGRFPEEILDDELVGETTYVQSFADGKAMLQQLVARKNGSLPTPCLVSIRPMRLAMTSKLAIPTKRAQPKLMTWHNLRQQHGGRPSGKSNYCLSDFVASERADNGGAAGWMSAFAVSAGLGIGGKLAEFATVPMTTARSCSNRWPTVWPKPVPGGCMRKSGAITGATPQRNTRNATLIREVSWYSPAPGFLPAGSWPRGALFAPARRTGQRGHGHHREFRDDPGCGGFRLLPGASTGAVLPINKNCPRPAEDWARRSGVALPDAKRWLAPVLWHGIHGIACVC